MDKYFNFVIKLEGYNQISDLNYPSDDFEADELRAVVKYEFDEISNLGIRMSVYDITDVTFQGSSITWTDGEDIKEEVKVEATQPEWTIKFDRESGTILNEARIDFKEKTIEFYFEY